MIAPDWQKRPGMLSRRASFVELYVLERAGTFSKGKEKEEAYWATVDGEGVYDTIQQREAFYLQGLQQGPQQAVPGLAQQGPPGYPYVTDSQAWTGRTVK